MKIFSFFSGLGFLDLGFEDTEYEVVYVNEIHEPFLEAYKYAREKMDYPKPPLGYEQQDILKLLNPSKIEWFKDEIRKYREDNHPVGFIGGPPCPDFSVGGKNRGRKGDNGKLSGTYVEIVKQASPDFFLFENVKGLWRTKKHRAFYEELKKKLEEDFVLTERLINSIEFGVPQDRDRIILLGFNKDFIERTEAKIDQENIDTHFPWHKYTSGKGEEIFELNWADTDDFKPNSKRAFKNSVPKELTVQHWFEKNKVDEHPNATHHFIPRAAKPKFEVIKEGDDSKKSYKRLHRWRYSPTAAYGNNEVHLHPYKVRRLSAAESLAIQSMPKEFSLPDDMTLTNMFKGIGNGVPYLASKGLAKTIKDFIENL